MLAKKLIYTTSVVGLASICMAFTVLPKKSEISGVYCNKLKNEVVYKGPLEQFRVLIEGKDGWVFRTGNDFRNDFSVNETTKNYLLVLQKSLKEKNIDLVIAYPPVRGMIHHAHLTDKQKSMYGLDNPEKVWNNYESSIASLRKSGLNIIGMSQSEVTDDFYYKRNHHWTASATKATANKLAQHIKALPAYNDIPKVPYTTYDGEQIAYKSSFEKAFEKICGAKVPPEMITEYKTTQTKSATTEQGLFDEQANPKVVLLGTSNSVEEAASANFEGFLKEALSADVYNMAYIGAGIDTSIISFLNSDMYREGNVRVVIWEVPGYYDFNIMDDKLFQQIIPAVYGGCESTPVASKMLSSLPGGRNVLFDLTGLPKDPKASADKSAAPDATAAAPAPAENDLSGMRDTGARHYIKFLFSKPVKDPFSLKFQYAGNGTKKQDFDRSERYPHDNAFYSLFPGGESNKNLELVTMEVPPEMKGMTVRAEVCSLPETASF